MTTDHPGFDRTTWSTRLYKGMLVSFVALALVVPLALAALPFIEFFNGMAAQPKAKTQMTYGRVFGQTLLAERRPPANTVPRTRISTTLPDGPATLDAARKLGADLTNPIPRTLDNMRRGRELFNVYCAVCHGTGGLGDGPVVGPGRFPAPPSLHTPQARSYSDGTVFYIVSKGTEKMPSYAAQLEPRERWQVIHYLRALQLSMNPPAQELDR